MVMKVRESAQETTLKAAFPLKAAVQVINFANRDHIIYINDGPGANTHHIVRKSSHSGQTFSEAWCSIHLVSIDSDEASEISSSSGLYEPSCSDLE